MRVQVDVLCWTPSKHNSMASCVASRNLLQVRMAGPAVCLSLSSLLVASAAKRIERHRGIQLLGRAVATLLLWHRLSTWATTTWAPLIGHMGLPAPSGLWWQGVSLGMGIPSLEMRATLEVSNDKDRARARVARGWLT